MRASCLATFASTLVASISIVGCVQEPPKSRVEKDLDTVRAEETPEKLFARGRAFANVADFTRAEQYLSAAIDAGGDAREILPILLRVCVAERRYRVAIDYTQRYLRRQPADHRMRLVLGTLYVNVGEPEAAKEELDRVLAADPDAAPAHYARGVLARDEKDAVTADRHFREYLRIDPRGSHADEARGSLLQEVP